MGSAIAPLAYNGEIIHEKAEMLSLTDMWRAAGSPSGRGPSDWLDLVTTNEFVAIVESTLNAGIPGIKTKKGRGGGTFAHWQIALAYAKYLDHAFHMWCNTVVRERMEGTSEPSNAVEMVGLSDEVRRAIGGIVKSCAGVVVREALTEILPLMVEREFQSNARIAALEYVSVRGLLDEAKATIKGRGRLNRKVGWELRSKALLAKPPIQLRRCPHSGVWLFPREFAMAYMGERGMMLVLEHNEGQGAQKVIQFPRGGGKPKPVA